MRIPKSKKVDTISLIDYETTLTAKQLTIQQLAEVDLISKIAGQILSRELKSREYERKMLTTPEKLIGSL